MNPVLDVFDESMLRVDPPDHTRLRKLANKAFTPRAIERLRPRIEQIVHEPLWEPAPVLPPTGLRGSVHLDPVRADAFRVVLSGHSLRLIEATPGQLVTGMSVRPAEPGADLAADPADDTAKIAVLERHHGSGRRSIGLVRGLGLPRGAIASTMAHDTHHLVVCGTNDDDMTAAADHVRVLGGGLAVAVDGAVVADLPLPVGGLLSDRSFPNVVTAQRRIRKALHSLTGRGHDPFDTLQFLALPSFRCSSCRIRDWST